MRDFLVDSLVDSLRFLIAVGGFVLGLLVTIYGALALRSAFSGPGGPLVAVLIGSVGIAGGIAAGTFALKLTTRWLPAARWTPHWHRDHQ